MTISKSLFIKYSSNTTAMITKPSTRTVGGYTYTVVKQKSSENTTEEGSMESNNDKNVNGNFFHVQFLV